MIKVNLSPRHLLIVSLVLLAGCENDNAPNPVTIAQAWFERKLGENQIGLPKGIEANSIDWRHAITDGQRVEVPVSLKGELTGYVVSSQFLSTGSISIRLVLLPAENGYEAFLVELINESGSMPESLTEIMSEKFTGFIKVSTSQGVRYVTYFKDGKQNRNESLRQMKVQREMCIYFFYEYKITSGGKTYTWIERELQYCYDLSEPQLPLLDEGGALDFDYRGGEAGEEFKSPDLPQEAKDGDIYEVREPSGKIVRYTYNARTSGWELALVILPAVAVTADAYPLFFNIPTSFTIIGSDNLLYVYDEALLSWIGTPIVENNLTTPCLYDLIEKIRNNNFVNKIQKLFRDVFDNEQGNSMYSFTESANPIYTARTFLETRNGRQVRTDLNTQVLSAASLEYNTIIVYHEIIHAILFSQQLDGSLHHTAILESYVEQLAQSAVSLFPNLPHQDALAIALFGLGDIADQEPEVYSSVAANLGLTIEEISNIGTSYRRDNVAGNIKRGSPCN